MMTFDHVCGDAISTRWRGFAATTIMRDAEHVCLVRSRACLVYDMTYSYVIRGKLFLTITSWIAVYMFPSI